MWKPVYTELRHLKFGMSNAKNGPTEYKDWYWLRWSCHVLAAHRLHLGLPRKKKWDILLYWACISRVVIFSLSVTVIKCVPDFLGQHQGPRVSSSGAESNLWHSDVLLTDSHGFWIDWTQEQLKPRKLLCCQHKPKMFLYKETWKAQENPITVAENAAWPVWSMDTQIGAVSP